jgi:nicotinamide-nucleotide adenylyltransferase
VRGLLVGRFQPFHQGHLAAVRAIRAARPETPLVVGVGSAQASHTPLNPFTAGERIDMIELALEEAQIDRVRAYPIPDVNRHAVWVAHVVSLVPAFDRVHTNNPLTRLLFEAEGFAVEAPTLVERGRFEGRSIRAAMAAGEEWSHEVPPAVTAFLRSIKGADRVRGLSESGAGVTPEHSYG